MPKFNYVAMDSRGKETKGTLEVANQNEAIGRLKEMGFFPTKVVELTEKSKEAANAKGAPAKKGGKPRAKGGGIQIKIPGFGGGVKSKVLSTFTRQLATLVDAGLPLLRGMRVLEKQERNVVLKGIIGELGRSIEVALARLAEFMEKAEKIKGKVVAAMFYPVAVMFVAGAILMVLMIFVIPKFRDIFKDMMPGSDLPAFTRFVLAISEAIKDNFIMVFIGLLVVGFAFVSFVKTRFGRRLFDRFKLNMPGLGPVVSKVAIARFTRTLGTLISSGVPILQALNIVKETAGNVIISEAVEAVHESVKEGETITAPLEAANVFPPMVISMVDVGEQTGALPEMLMKIADNFDEEVDNAVAAMTSLLEPVMIVFLAVIVGSIVIALFLPLIKLMEGIGDSDSGGPKGGS